MSADRLTFQFVRFAILAIVTVALAGFAGVFGT